MMKYFDCNNGCIPRTSLPIVQLFLYSIILTDLIPTTTSFSLITTSSTRVQSPCYYKTVVLSSSSSSSSRLRYRNEQNDCRLFQSTIGVDAGSGSSGSNIDPFNSIDDASLIVRNDSNTGSSSNRQQQQPQELLPVVVEASNQHQQQVTSQNHDSIHSNEPKLIDRTDYDDAVLVVTIPNNDEYDMLRKNIFNALLLACTFGYAAYTIFNIDHGMTRGWTQSEIAMRIPLDNWLNYESSLNDRPIITKTAINVIIYLLGDWLSQTAFSGNHILNFNAARTIRNGFIGLCFGPLVHEYYQFSDHILPVDGGMFIRLQKILMDQTIYLSVKCSIYISAVGILQGDDLSTVKHNVQSKLPSIVLTAWKFWPLVHLVTYGVIPARHRILWVNCVDLVWNAILATMSQKKEIDTSVTEDGIGIDQPTVIYEATVTDDIISRNSTQELLYDASEHALQQSNTSFVQINAT
jgi:protein Mpv17